MDKFNRNYILAVETRDGRTITMRNPFTIEFEVHRNSLSSANTSSVRIFNLNADNRNQIAKDQYDIGDVRKVELRAGYGDKLSLVFQGNIFKAWSTREGTEMVTTIESFDSGLAYINAVSNNQFPSMTNRDTILRSLIESMPGVTLGAIGNFDSQITRGMSVNGNTVDILREQTGNGFFIDNGKAYCLQQDEYIEGDIPLITSGSGLLGTPTKEETYINLEMLFEPALKIGQLIRLETTSATHFNGLHKVLALKHRGVISEAIAGRATTSVGLLPGSQQFFKPVANARS